MIRRAATDPQPPSALARLLETEAHLEAVLAQARERAARLLLDAEREAAERAAALDTELADATAQADGRRSADCSARLAALAAQHDRALGRLRGIDPQRLGDLARWICQEVLKQAPGGDAP